MLYIHSCCIPNQFLTSNFSCLVSLHKFGSWVGFGLDNPRINNYFHLIIISSAFQNIEVNVLFHVIQCMIVNAQYTCHS